MTNGSAADVARRGTHGGTDADELLDGGGNSGQVVLCVFPPAQLAARDCIACDMLHDDVSTPVTQEDEVDLGGAHNAHRVGVHDLGHLVLCEGLTQGDTGAVLDPESGNAFDLEADAIPVVTSGGTLLDDVITRREVFRGVRGTMLNLLYRHS